MCACYKDKDSRLMSDADNGYPTNCTPTSHLRGAGREMKFSEMIPPSFLLSRIQETTKRPPVRPFPPCSASKVKVSAPKSCKCKRNVGVNTCKVDEIPCQRCANNSANSGSNVVPLWSPMVAGSPPHVAFMNPIARVANQCRISPPVRPAGLPSKTCPPFDPCTGQEIGSHRSNDCGNFLPCQQMPNSSSGFCPTAQYYPIPPEAFISEPPQQCMNATQTLESSRPSSTTSVSNTSAKNCSSTRSVNTYAPKVSYKLENPSSRCPQKSLKPNKRPTRGVSCQCNVEDRDRDRHRTQACCQIHVKDKNNSPPFVNALGKYGVKKSNFSCMNNNKYPRHDCLSKDKKKAQPTSGYKCNNPVSSKEKSRNSKQPTNSRNKFIHCVAESPNLIERICNSMRIPLPPDSCYILLPLNVATNSKLQSGNTGPKTDSPATCNEEDNKCTCSNKSVKSKSKSMRTRGCNTDDFVTGKGATDNDEANKNHGSCCASDLSYGPRLTYYFNPYTGHFHPWYSPMYCYSGCSRSCPHSCPNSCALPTSKSKVSSSNNSKSRSCSPSKSPHSAEPKLPLHPEDDEIDNRWNGYDECAANEAAHGAQYRPAPRSKPPSPINSGHNICPSGL